jgi:hypothetical protein
MHMTNPSLTDPHIIACKSHKGTWAYGPYLARGATLRPVFTGMGNASRLLPGFETYVTF